MADNKYLVSQSYLDREKRSKQNLARGLASQQNRRPNDKPSNIKYLVEITGRYTGTDWDVDNDIAYAGRQVYIDSAGYDITPITTGAIFGNDANSASLPPIVDLTMLNYVNVDLRRAEEVTIDIGTVVEVFSTYTKAEEFLYYTYGAKSHEYENDAGFPIDSAMIFDSNGTESAFIEDSGWPTAKHNGGFQITVQTRTFYGADSTQDRILYAYYRDFLYNCHGCLVSMTEERRQVIDDPTSCV
jgi:hypothetical protein